MFSVGITYAHSSNREHNSFKTPIKTMYRYVLGWIQTVDVQCNSAFSAAQPSLCTLCQAKSQEGFLQYPPPQKKSLCSHPDLLKDPPRANISTLKTLTSFYKPCQILVLITGRKEISSETLGVKFRMTKLQPAKWSVQLNWRLTKTRKLNNSQLPPSSN